MAKFFTFTGCKFCRPNHRVTELQFNRFFIYGDNCISTRQLVSSLYEGLGRSVRSRGGDFDSVVGMEEVITAADASSNLRSYSSESAVLPTNLPLLSAFLFKEIKWDTRRMLTSGGMPSSHSATVTALAACIGLQDGIGSSSFAIAMVLACVVMYDATGVRLHAGRQAELLNQIVCELPPEHPFSNARPLRDSLGHTPLQEFGIRDALEATPSSRTRYHWL